MFFNYRQPAGRRNQALIPGSAPIIYLHNHHYWPAILCRADPNLLKRVTHAAVTPNRHLSAVLEFIKEEQAKAPDI